MELIAATTASHNYLGFDVIHFGVVPKTLSVFYNNANYFLTLVFKKWKLVLTTSMYC